MFFTVVEIMECWAVFGRDIQKIGISMKILPNNIKYDQNIIALTNKRDKCEFQLGNGC